MVDVNSATRHRTRPPAGTRSISIASETNGGATAFRGVTYLCSSASVLLDEKTCWPRCSPGKGPSRIPLRLQTAASRIVFGILDDASAIGALSLAGDPGEFTGARVAPGAVGVMAGNGGGTATDDGDQITAMREAVGQYIPTPARPEHPFVVRVLAGIGRQRIIVDFLHIGVESVNHASNKIPLYESLVHPMAHVLLRTVCPPQIESPSRL